MATRLELGALEGPESGKDGIMEQSWEGTLGGPTEIKELVDIGVGQP